MTVGLADRVALVTGASGDIGRALAVALAEAGCDVAVHYGANQQAAEITAEQVQAAGRRALLLRADLEDAEASDTLVSRVEAGLGPIDVLVPNAGYANRVDSLAAVSTEEWQQTLALNLTSPFILISRVIDGMAERGFGRVLLMSSIAAFTGGGVGPHYAASKAGLHGLVYWLAGRYAKAGVTVNAVAPALVVSGMVGADYDPTLVPVGRLGTAEEVAHVAMTMVTNSYLTGKIYLVDGGIRAQ